MTQDIAPAPPPSVLLPALAVAATIFTWATSFPAIGLALREIAPLPLASIRFAIAAAIALGLLAWRRPRGLTRRDGGIVALCGVLGIALYNVFLNMGQSTVSSGAAAFIVNTQPLFMAILAVLVLGETFNRWGWIGAGIGFTGVAIIAAGQPGGLSFGTGASLILAAAFCAASYSVLQRPLFARAAAFDVTLLVLVAGAVALLPWLAEGWQQASEASPRTLLTVLFLAIAPGLIGQSCWAYAIGHFGAARAGQFLYLIPPGSVLIAWPLLGEVPRIETLLGGALALTGVIVVNSRGRARR